MTGLWDGLTSLIRAHQWTPLELFVLILVWGFLLIVAVDVVYDGVHRLRVWRWRRAIARLQGGPTRDHYADPGRMHRETAGEVDRLARRLPAAQSPVPLAGPVLGRGSVPRSDTTTEGVEPGASQSRGDARTAAVADRRVDRTTDYGAGTALVFPGHAAPKKRVNGHES